jgi:AcrR family transcriptional regulator
MQGNAAVLPAPIRKARANGQQAREKILSEALVLFAEKGYAGTSVRDVAGAAGVNLAAIAYHFGDKEGLYRAALHEPVGRLGSDISCFDEPGLPLDDALRMYIRTCLRPFGMGKAALLSVRLRVRERFEPTGLLESPAAGRDRAYQRLLEMLARHFGLEAPDSELQALAFSIFSLIAQLYYNHDHLAAVEPTLLDAPGAADGWERRFTAYAGAMVAVETTRRNTAARVRQGPDDAHPTNLSTQAADD